jgi:hypothetical protein
MVNILAIPILFSGATTHRESGHSGFYITHNDTSQSIGLLWKRDQLFAETSTCQHNTCKRQTSTSQAGFKSVIPLSERPQTLLLDRSATEIGQYHKIDHKNILDVCKDSCRCTCFLYMLPLLDWAVWLYTIILWRQITTCCAVLFRLCMPMEHVL